MKHLTPPDPLPDYIAKCKGCGASYRVASSEFRTEKFKTSGYHFDGTAVIEKLDFVVCLHCSRDLFKRDMDAVPAEAV